ncbi:MAG: acyl-CoA synthetase (AMP-forming)/AMP-acid ligase II [Gammaproteobacteria bacterium]|jgi:acyl-CoA synthetase (AMP-forming)/AMP-acid ligase II
MNDIMNAKTLWLGLLDTAQRQAALPCIAISPREQRDYLPAGMLWSYAETAERANRLIERYAAAGYGHGHRVSLLLENRPEFMLHFLALNALGCWVIPLNPDFRTDDFAYVLGHSEADLIISLARHIPNLQAAVNASERRIPIVDLAAFDDALPRASRAAKSTPPDRESESVLMYTSGTTGMPKGCIINNEYFFFAAERYLGAGGTMTIEHGAERLYNPLPLFYANGLAIANPAMILSRNCMIFTDRFHASTWWQEIVASQATMIHYLGIIPPVLSLRPESPLERQHKVRFGVGAGVDPGLRMTFEARFGITLVEIYGMSEIGICSFDVSTERDGKTRSVGRDLPGMDYQIVDDDGNEQALGTPGELRVRRAGADPRRGLLKQYFRDAETTAEVWRDGWFHTGDMLVETAAGLVYVDRKKDMIRRSGQNISAAEVEVSLRAHPAVHQVAIIPVADELRDEEVFACVVLNDDAPPTPQLAEQLVRFSLERLAYFKVPGWVAFLETLPTTYSQKLRKGEIFGASDPREHAAAMDLRTVKLTRGKDAAAPGH